MSRRPRRNHTSAFKAKVAIAAIKGDRTLVRLAEQPLRCEDEVGVNGWPQVIPDYEYNWLLQSRISIATLGGIP